jgi:hypothetical protein
MREEEEEEEEERTENKQAPHNSVQDAKEYSV